MKIQGKKAATADTHIINDFYVTQRHQSRGRVQEILSANSTQVFNAATRKMDSEPDMESFTKALISDRIVDWRGLDIATLELLAPLNEGEELDIPYAKEGQDVPCNHSAAVFTDAKGLLGTKGTTYTLPEFIYHRARIDRFRDRLDQVNGAMDTAYAEAAQEKKGS